MSLCEFLMKAYWESPEYTEAFVDMSNKGIITAIEKFCEGEK